MIQKCNTVWLFEWLNVMKSKQDDLKRLKVSREPKIREIQVSLLPYSKCTLKHPLF